MADIVAKVIPNNIIQTRFGDQNQPQTVQTILNNPSGTLYIQNLADVDITGLKDQSVLIYDASSNKFKVNQTKFDVADGGNF